MMREVFAMKQSKFDENSIVVIDCHKFSSSLAAARARKVEIEELTAHLSILWAEAKKHTDLDIEATSPSATKREISGRCAVQLFGIEEILPSWRGAGPILLPRALDKAALIVVNDSRNKRNYGQDCVNAILRGRGPIVRSTGAGRKAPLIAPYAFLKASGGAFCTSSDFETQRHREMIADVMGNEAFLAAAKNAIVYREMPVAPLARPVAAKPMVSAVLANG